LQGAEIFFNDSSAVLAREPVDAVFSDARLEEIWMSVDYIRLETLVAGAGFEPATFGL
jgi:hypothetical protein